MLAGPVGALSLGRRLYFCGSLGSTECLTPFLRQLLGKDGDLGVKTKGVFFYGLQPGHFFPESAGLVLQITLGLSQGA